MIKQGFRTSTTPWPKRLLPRLVPDLHERPSAAGVDQKIPDFPPDLRVEVALDIDFLGHDRGERVEEDLVGARYHALALEIDFERLQVAVFAQASQGTM